MNTSKVGVVLIHGAGFSSWIWQDVTRQLQMPFITVDLPHRGEAKESRSSLTLAEYVTAITAATETLQADKIVLVAHSLGGVLGLAATEALQDRLAGFIAVCASIPASGKSFVSALPFPQKFLMPIILRTAGTQPPESVIRSGLCNDLSAEQTQKIINTFSAESAAVFTTPIRYSPLQVPTLYIRTTNDKEYGMALQTKMANTLPHPKIIDMPSGHLPMLSHPNDVANAIQQFCETIA